MANSRISGDVDATKEEEEADEEKEEEEAEEEVVVVDDEETAVVGEDALGVVEDEDEEVGDVVVVVVAAEEDAARTTAGPSCALRRWPLCPQVLTTRQHPSHAHLHAGSATAICIHVYVPLPPSSGETDAPCAMHPKEERVVPPPSSEHNRHATLPQPRRALTNSSAALPAVFGMCVNT